MIHNKPSQQLIDIGLKISKFYLEKNNGDYNAAMIDVQNVNIIDIKLLGTNLEIYTSRPGYLIGRKGKNIDALQEFLKDYKILIFESFNWNDILIPQNYAEWYEYEKAYPADSEDWYVDESTIDSSDL